MRRTTHLAGVVLAAGVAAAAAMAHAQIAPMAPPSILKEDCGKLKGKGKAQCESRNAADAKVQTAQPEHTSSSDMPTGADADVPGEPPSPRPVPAGTATGSSGSAAGSPGSSAGQVGKPAVKPAAGEGIQGKDADPPAESMQPLLPDGTPDPRGPLPSRGQGSSASSSSSSSAGGPVPVGSSSSSADDEDAPPTMAGSDSPVAPGALKDLGSSGKVSSDAARARLEASRVADDVKVGRYYLKLGNTAGAEARFKDALQHDPEDPEATFAMAELLLKQQKTPEAAAELRRYLVLAPDDEHTKEAKKLLAKLGK